MNHIFVISVVIVVVIVGEANHVLARLCSKPLSQCEHKWNQPSGTVDGVVIPWNGDFPCAEHPYGQHPDGCSGFSDPEQVKDTWGPVSFVDACNSHDRCYYTLGSLMSECNMQFLKDLEYACKRDLMGVLDPRYGSCLTVAADYYAAVVSFQGTAHPAAQECQEKYEQYVDFVVNNAWNSGSQSDSPEGGLVAGMVEGNRQEAVLMLLNQYLTTGF